MKRILYLFISLLILSSCNKSSKIEIAGTIENGVGKKLTFSELLISGTQEIDTIRLDSIGNFKFKSSTDIPRFYHLSVSKNTFLTLLIEPGESVQINADASYMSKAIIKGSESSGLIQKINNQLIDTKARLDSLTDYIETIKGSDKFDQEINGINNSYAVIVDEQRDSSIAFIINNLNNLASIVALYQKYDDKNFVLYKNRDLQYIKIVSEALIKKYPESNHVKALIADKENLFKRYNQLKTDMQLNEITKNQDVVSIPEIYLPNQYGDSVSINGIDAKYILLNFWATWSKESIQRNIELKEIYKKYHSKGFEIYQVSLDTKKENWTRIIDFDQLSWINVIDLNGRTSYYAKIYNIRDLPTSFLINPDGDIVSVNPSKKQLTSTFEYAFK
ncbi:MAG: TlpA disulfide reductase family protein [Bacteroidales bacterium]|jgi:peroxiredoxin|nr:TlpA disulfide reductase family protein [Bacteroidales bacterium]